MKKTKTFIILFITILQIVFILLKIGNFINWSWLTVFSPLIIIFTLLTLAYMLILTLYLLFGGHK